MKWTYAPRVSHSAIGLIPHLIWDNATPAREIFAKTYAHGGGWNPFEGFKLVIRDDGRRTIKYPGDPALVELASAVRPTTGETIVVFQHAWVMVIQPNGDFEISRMD